MCQTTQKVQTSFLKGLQVPKAVAWDARDGYDISLMKTPWWTGIDFKGPAGFVTLVMASDLSRPVAISQTSAPSLVPLPVRVRVSKLVL